MPLLLPPQRPFREAGYRSGTRQMTRIFIVCIVVVVRCLCMLLAYRAEDCVPPNTPNCKSDCARKRENTISIYKTEVRYPACI